AAGDGGDRWLAAVDASQDQGWFGRDRADGAHRDAEAPGGTIGRHQIDRRYIGAHAGDEILHVKIDLVLWHPNLPDLDGSHPLHLAHGALRWPVTSRVAASAALTCDKIASAQHL